MVVAELFAKLGLTPDHSSFDKGHEMIESLHHAMEAFLGVEGLKKVKEMVEGTVEAAVSAKHMSEQLGISTDAVQALGYAADVTGASSEVMQNAMQRLALGMEHARKTGSGPLVDGLSQLHVSFSSLRGKTPDQAMSVLADAFSKAGPKVNKTAVAMEIFGRSAGPRLNPLLNKGAAGIAQLTQEAKDLGVVMDGEAIEKSEEFEIAQKRLGATLTGLRNQAVMALLPTLQKMVESLMEWVKENREAIASTLQAVMEGIAEAFHLVAEAVQFATRLYHEHKDVVIAALAAIGIVLTIFAIKAAIAWAIAFAPVALAIAVIAALILGIKKLAEYVTGQEVTWQDMWDAVVAAGEAFVDWVVALPGRVGDFFVSIGQGIKDVFTDAWNWVKKTAHEAWEDIKDIPVIGHIIKGGAWLAGAVSDTLSGGGIASQMIEMQKNPEAFRARMEGGGATNAVTVNSGGVTVNVSGMSADEVHKLSTMTAAEYLQDQIRQAHNAIGGTPPAGR